MTNKPKSAIKAVRGMNDILPQQTPYWQFVEQAFYDVAEQYSYQEIRFPIVESTDLFKRSIGEVTDIVEKEMYTFYDRNGDSLSLRPEGTAVCVRACLQHGLLHNQTQRLWYSGPMFRHERPQKGRYRQFQQFGVENFGLAGPDADAELIAFSARLWQRLGIASDVTLQINSLGSLESRKQYRQVLIEYLTAHQEQLDEDSQRRLTTNPLRILDSKNPGMQDLIQQAPKLIDHIDIESKQHFESLCQLLDQINIPYEINPYLVRGLDYYSRTVFEWVTDYLGAQGTVCAGGRYDSLVEQLGGKETPAVGFAMGVERLILLLMNHQDEADIIRKPDAYLVMMGAEAEQQGFALAEKLREQLPQLRLLVNCGGGNYKKQFKRADQSGAKVALILGEDEIQKQCISVKLLQEKGAEQQQLSFNKLCELLQGH